MHTKLIEIITQDVTRLFQLNGEDLFDLKLEYGMKYIDDRYPATECWREPNDIAQALKNSPIFWNWWLQLWATRDRHLMKHCEAKQYGVSYSFQSNCVKGNATLMVSRKLIHDDLWDFYQDFHYWRKVQFYPNEVLISQCMATMQSPDQVLLTIKQ
jgi:hypothetical protein